MNGLIQLHDLGKQTQSAPSLLRPRHSLHSLIILTLSLIILDLLGHGPAHAGPLLGQFGTLLGKFSLLLGSILACWSFSSCSIRSGRPSSPSARP